MYISYSNVLFPGLDEDFGEVSLVLIFKVHLRFIGFDFDEDVSRGDFVAGCFLPGSDRALGHGWTQCWHCYYSMAGEGCSTGLASWTPRFTEDQERWGIHFDA
jgi:hypothetical protein